MQDSGESLETQQRYLAAHLLSYATSRLFPDIILLGCGLNTIGFYADFIFSNPFPSSLLELIEQEMVRLSKEALPVRSVSMMRENAQGMFEHFGHYCLAENVALHEENVIDLLQIEDFYSVSPPISITSSSDSGSFRLLGSEQLALQEEGGYVIRIEGVVKENPQGLKQFVKNYHYFLKRRDHRILGPELKLFEFCQEAEPFELIWLPKGLQLKEILFSLIRSQRPGAFLISTPSWIKSSFMQGSQERGSFHFHEEEYSPRASLKDSHRAFLEHKRVKSQGVPFYLVERSFLMKFSPEASRLGLLNRCFFETVQTSILSDRNEVVPILISSLHFIEQIIMMLGLKAKWRLVLSSRRGKESWRSKTSVQYLKEAFEGREHELKIEGDLYEQAGDSTCLELLVHDSLQRKWSLANLSVEAQDPSFHHFVITEQFFSSIEAVIALLLDSNEGVFPLWLAPEQFRIFAIGENCKVYAQELEASLQEKGLRGCVESRKAKLDVLVHEAEKERIPYLLIVGDKERLKNQVMVRSQTSLNHKGCVMSKEEIVEKIIQESSPPKGMIQVMTSSDQEIVLFKDKIRGDKKSLES